MPKVLTTDPKLPECASLEAKYIIGHVHRLEPILLRLPPYANNPLMYDMYDCMTAVAYIDNEAHLPMVAICSSCCVTMVLSSSGLSKFSLSIVSTDSSLDVT